MNGQRGRAGVRTTLGMLGASAFLAVAGCDGCGDPERPTLPVQAVERPIDTAPPERAEGSGVPTNGDEAVVALAVSGDGVVDVPAPPATPVRSLPIPAESLAVGAIVGDWTGVRGDAARSGLREAPAITNPRVAWSIEVGIQGYANPPIVTADAIYVSSQGSRHNNGPNRVDEADGVLRINPTTGAVVWRLPLAQDQNGMVLAGTTLLVGGDAGNLVAIDTVAGTVRWQVNVGCAIYQAPLVLGDRILLPRVGGVGMLRLSDGQPVDGTLPPCDVNRREAFSSDGETAWLSANDRPLEAWTAAGPVWRAPEAVASRRGSLEAWQPALVTQDLVLLAYQRWPFPQADGSIERRPAIVAHWKDTAQAAWVIDVNDPAAAEDERSFPSMFLHSTPWLHGTQLVVTPTNRGVVVLYDATTGEQTGTIRLPDCRRRQFASLVGVPGMAYYARHDGVLYGLQLADQPGVAWSLSLGLHGAAGGRETHEPIVGGCSPNPINGSALFATPAIGTDGTVYVNAGDGWLYAVRDTSWPALDAAAAPAAPATP